jgi:hypothetical protein
VQLEEKAHTDYLLVVVCVLHTPFMHIVHTPLMHCSIFEDCPSCGGPPVVLHTPFMQVVQKLLIHDVEVDDDVEVDGGIGTDDLRLGGIIGVIQPQLGLLIPM